MLAVASICAEERGPWDAFVAARPDGHLLQTFAWGELKAAFAWEPLRLAVVDEGEIRAAAQVLFRRFFHLSLAYVPRGPVVDWQDEEVAGLLFRAMLQAACARGAVFLKVEPNWPDEQTVAARLLSLGFCPARTVQPRNSLVVDLTGSQEDLLAQMRKHTRYGIRAAKRQGVVVRPAAGPEEVALFYDLLLDTAGRKGFRIHGQPYYEQVYRLFNETGQAALLFGERDGQLLSALWVVACGPEAIYMYAASRGQAYMAPYLLLWEAMLWAAARGCTRYDLWGIPEKAVAGAALAPLSAIETSDPLWGVYIFKRGFRGKLLRTVGAYDFPCRPLLYRAYRMIEKHSRPF